MNKLDKELLLQDLCARLPYRTMVKCNTDYRHEFDEELSEIHIMNFYQFEIKPYLRPMSSMTEEELNNLSQHSGLVYDNLLLASFQNGTYKCLDFYLSEVPANVVILVFDWLNAHHFDYRGLIEKGLALEAPEGMYN